MPPAAKPTEPRDFRREVRIFWIAVLSVPSLILLGLFLAWVGAFGALPSTEEIANPKSFLATQIVDANGEQLGTFLKKTASTPSTINFLPTWSKPWWPPKTSGFTSTPE